MKRFTIQLFVLSVIVGLLIQVWNLYGPENKYFNHGWILLGFFVISTWLVHFILTKSAAKNSAHFVRTFMVTTVFKLLIYLIYILLYYFVDPNNIAIFLMGFLFHYLIYSVFEVVFVLKFFKP